MRVSGRIAEGAKASLANWQVEQELEQIQAGEARYSKGFLAADPLIWCVELLEQWRPFFHSLGVEVEWCGIRREFSIPDEIKECSGEFFAEIELDGEYGLIGFDSVSAAALADVIVPGLEVELRGVLLDYLRRRIASSIQRSWTASETITLSYKTPDSKGSGVRVAQERIAATVILDFTVNGTSSSVYFAFGSQVLSMLDSCARREVLRSQAVDEDTLVSDRIHTVSFDIAELSVPPAMLIDYMRSGTLIDLQIPVSKKVSIAVDGEPWAEGELCQFNEFFAVKVDGLVSPEEVPTEGTTKVRIEVAEVELDEESLVEHGQKGAVLSTNTPLSSRASLVIGKEAVAEAIIGVLGDNFAVTILPK